MPTCVVCNKRFTREENLSYHMMSYHQNFQERHSKKCEKSKDTERMFNKIRSNQYLSTQKSMLKKDIPKCSCPANAECGEDCINKIMLYECDSDCGKNCKNKTIQTSHPHSIEVFITPDKGWGIKAKRNIERESFIIEYVGEIINEFEHKTRMQTKYSKDAHHYGMYLESGFVIDARDMGNISRFINHSCDPNCYVQKWFVKRLPCLAIFALRSIPAGEELTINYNFQLYNNYEEKICKCNARNCSKTLGKKVCVSV